MNEQERIAIINKAKNYFKDELVSAHINTACKKASQLKNYNVNPFLFKYLANFLKGNDSPRSIAEALVLPRVLGSSITTSFGMRTQTLISNVFEGFGSTTPGIDIEFIDAIDGRKKYCQLKSGPNTINSGDVKTVIEHFKGIRNLARTNNLRVDISDLIVGILYGEYYELNSHYKKIADDFPVVIGKDFWHRLTGKENFYFDLIEAFGEVAFEVDGTTILEETIQNLTLDITAYLSNE